MVEKIREEGEKQGKKLGEKEFNCLFLSPPYWLFPMKPQVIPYTSQFTSPEKGTYLFMKASCAHCVSPGRKEQWRA